MEFTKQDMKITKGVAILFMLLLHLFCRKDVQGLYDTFPKINGVPLVYYIGLFGDACVPIFCFASGYGLFISLRNEKGSLLWKNFIRIFKLLINYWIVFGLFVIVGVLAGKSDILPGSPINFILNFLVLSNSYNGAWWFVQTYIILVLITPYLFKVVNKYNSKLLLFISFLIYLATYVQRIKHVIDLGNHTALTTIVNAIVLVGTSQLPFLIGAVFAKEKTYSKLLNLFNRFSQKNLICIIGIILLVLIHSQYESMIISPITGIAFICLFNLMNKGRRLIKVLDYIGTHSTNLWLTHMFFYMTIFPSIVFALKYPILIFGWLIILCLISSYLIYFIYKPLLRIIDKKAVYIKSSEKVLG
ncbi:acyltransferase [Neobacillus niacini]|uniref:acyltransferase family protein n=1 Tax=Neobacillus niacini TaxID=86668 RepID=UPI0028657545|nr:acyltransferase [Neobacillus niacini]MDR7000619.1 surface polysaccharide O-acyltransferase-like enzyme [Neobacillus niacini]